MKKEIGKLYVHIYDEIHNNVVTNHELVILCTGKGKEEKQISGVVVKNTDPNSDFKVGDYSETWTWMLGNKCYYEEYTDQVILDNSDLDRTRICDNFPGIEKLPKESTWEVVIPDYNAFIET